MLELLAALKWLALVEMGWAEKLMEAADSQVRQSPMNSSMFQTRSPWNSVGVVGDWVRAAPLSSWLLWAARSHSNPQSPRCLPCSAWWVVAAHDVPRWRAPSFASTNSQSHAGLPCVSPSFVLRIPRHTPATLADSHNLALNYQRKTNKVSSTKMQHCCKDIRKIGIFDNTTTGLWWISKNQNVEFDFFESTRREFQQTLQKNYFNKIKTHPLS